MRVDAVGEGCAVPPGKETIYESDQILCDCI